MQSDLRRLSGHYASTSAAAQLAQPIKRRQPLRAVAEDRQNNSASEPQHSTDNVKRRYRRPWERWLGGAPRVRVRNLPDRQRDQLAELAVLNERLAGNKSTAVRRRIEWLKTRRKEWEQIYNYITKQDAEVSLAIIEEANKQVAAALSESVRERQGIANLKRRLVMLQGQLTDAHSRLQQSQARVQENLQRIQQFQAEATMLEDSTSSPVSSRLVASTSHRLTMQSLQKLQAMHPAWYPVAFTDQLPANGMAPFDLFGQPWLLFRDASGTAACIKDECAHRACPLSLGKVIDGEIQCPYHGWQYSSTGSCTLMPSTAFCTGIAVDALSCQEQHGLLWVWPQAAGQPAAPKAAHSVDQMQLPSLPGPHLQAGIQADLEMDSGVLLDWLLIKLPSLPPSPGQGLQARPAQALAHWLWQQLLDQTATWSTDLQGPFSLAASSASDGVAARQWHMCLPSKPGHVRWLFWLAVEVPQPVAKLPLAHSLLHWVASQMMAAELTLLRCTQQTTLEDKVLDARDSASASSEYLPGNA